MAISENTVNIFEFLKANYGKRFTSKQELISVIRNYISYYNNRRVQRGLGVLTPMEKYNLTLAA